MAITGFAWNWPGPLTNTGAATDRQTVHYCISKCLAPFRTCQLVTRTLTLRRERLPLIQVRVIKDVFSKEQKQQIISRLTDAMVSIEGENMRGVTWCVVEEVESGDWGIGGKALTTADVQALARAKAA